MGQPSAAGVRPTPTSTWWALETAPIRARRGTGSGPTGEGGRAAAGRGRGGARDPAVVGRGHGQPWPPHFSLPFIISANGCPIATWIGAGGAREARTGGCLPGASCNPRVTGCCCRRRQAHGLPERGGGGAAGVFPLRFSTAYRHPIVAIMAAGAVGSAATELSGGGGCTWGDRSAPPCWRRTPPDGGYCTVRYPRLVV